jgi:NAD(P)-dependent dehydrogenase (short-subunit alcohol dehydrogenase family)
VNVGDAVGEVELFEVPGAVDAMFSTIDRRLGPPEEVAQVVRFLCLEAPDYLTGEFISIRGDRL